MSFKLTKYQNYVRGLLSPLLQTSKKKFNLLTKRFKYHVSTVYLIYFKKHFELPTTHSKPIFLQSTAEVFISVIVKCCVFVFNNIFLASLVTLRLA